MGGHDEKLKNFGKSKKKSVIFTNQTISSKKFFRKKMFEIEIANVIFRSILNESENFFLIDRANLTRYSETRSLSDQNCMLKNF